MAQQPTLDRALIAQFQQGDQRAFEILFARHRDQVYTKLYLLVRDHDVAADLFQDVFIKVVDVLRSGRYNEEGKFLPWVLRIAHNAGIDHFRRQKKMPMSRGTEEYDLLGNIAESGATREDEMIGERIAEDLQALVAQLPVEQQAVVHAHPQGHELQGHRGRDRREHQHRARSHALCVDQPAPHDGGTGRLPDARLTTDRPDTRIFGSRGNTLRLLAFLPRPTSG